MIRSGTLPLNVVVAGFYLIVAGISLFVLKKAYRPLTRFKKSNQSPKRVQHKKQQTNEINYDRVLAMSFIKKYTLIGSIWQGDKKYLLKQFLFMATFAVSCLKINRVILWPCSLSICLFAVSFLLWQFLLKGIESSLKCQKQNKINIEQKGQSQIEIDFNHLETKINIIPAKKELAKLEIKQNRNIFQIVIVSVVGFASVVMLMHTVMTLSISISNSGQLNILSFLAAVAIDQLGMRPVLGLSVWTACKIYLHVSQQKMEQALQGIYIISLLCQEELTTIHIEQQKDRLKKEQQITISPPRKKTSSPSGVPKANLSAQRQHYLNLLNLESTVRNQNDDNIDEIILTSAEKELFESNSQQQNGYYTKRLRNRDNGDIHSFSANNKGTTIDMNEKKQVDDLVILKDNPFNDLENIPSGEFFLEDSIIRKAKRRGYKKRCKRNLKLIGNSPYLEYLPDMLKKVQQYKNMSGTNISAREKKIL